MVDRIKLNGMLTRAVMRKDFANRLLSQNNSTRERALGEFELDLTDQQKRELMEAKLSNLRELMEFCYEKFNL